MKKVSIYLLFIALFLGLSACEENSTTVLPNQEPSEKPDEKPEKPDDGEEVNPDESIPDNEIHYIATEKIFGNYDIAFPGAVFRSNEWDEISGKGVITFEYPITTIGFHAFVSCRELIEIIIPNSVTVIETAAFDGCYNLTSITLPPNLKSIRADAFLNCWGLTTFKGGLSSSDGRCLIQEGNLIAFAPAGLTDYTIPDSVVSIGDYALSYQIYGASPTKIVIPDSVTTLGDYAFSRCKDLTEISIGNSVYSIGECAFEVCTGLTQVTIPAHVTWIGNSAFSGCENLSEIYCKPITPPAIGILAYIL